MRTYEVIGRSLVINGRRRQPGQRVRFADADAQILMDLGRLRVARGKAKPGDEVEADAEAEPEVEAEAEAVSTAEQPSE